MNDSGASSSDNVDHGALAKNVATLASHPEPQCSTASGLTSAGTMSLVIMRSLKVIQLP